MELEVLINHLDSTLSLVDYGSLVAQIEKDFVLTGIQFDFSDLKPQELVNALNEIIEELLSKEYAILLNLLYRIDIPESAINFDSSSNIQEQLVITILKREFQKVKLRQQYSS